MLNLNKIFSGFLVFMIVGCAGLPVFGAVKLPPDVKKTSPENAVNPLGKCPLNSASQQLPLSDRDIGDLRKYKNDDAFNYELRKPDRSWLERFMRWLDKLFGGKKSVVRFDPNILLISVKIAAVLVILFVIYKLFGVERFMPWHKKDKSLVIPGEEKEQNIHGYDYESAIAKAESEGNFGHAIRLWYLSILKQLNDKQLIKWAPEKTNSSYLAEISNSGLQQGFSFLTYCFDYTFYGAFPVREDQYGRMTEDFKSFSKQVGK